MTGDCHVRFCESPRVKSPRATHLRVRRMTSTGLAALGVLAGGLALCCPVALAGEGLGITATFGSSKSTMPDPEPLSRPPGVAVNQESGDVYVVDRGNNRVERFSSTGEYEAQFNGTEIDGAPAGAGKEAPAKFSEPSGIAIDNSCFYQKLSEPKCKAEHPSNGDVYVVDTGHGAIDKFNEAGEYTGQLARSPLGVAVDSFGNLWVYETPAGGYGARGPGDVAEFSETEFSKKEAPEKQCGTGRETSSALAVDSADNFYVVFGLGNLGKYNLGCEQQAQAETEAIGPVSALAVDLAPPYDLYVGLGTSLAQYGPFGEPFGAPLYRSGARSSTLSASGIAVNSTSHDVYVADSSKNLVDIFGVGPTPEVPKTENAEVKGPLVTFKGELLGGESGYYFAYNDNGSSCEGGGRTPEGKATGTAKVSTMIGVGLESNTLYTFCIVATSVYGQAPGLPLTVTTGVEPPVIEEVSTPGVGPYEATIAAKVNPENETATCLVQYGETTTYEEAPVPCEQASLSGHGGQPASARLGNLKPSTTYHYRVVAKNTTLESKPTEGTGHFTTAAALVPAIEAESVSVESVAGSGREVTFAAQVNPELQETTSCVFEYGETEAYGKQEPCEQSAQQIGKGNTGVTISAKVNGLVAGVDYHYCVVVKDRTGPSECKDQVFGPPVAVTGAVLSKVPGVAPGTTATVGGEVNPEELETRYYVEYGETEAYGQIAPYLPPGIKLPLGIDAGSGSVSVVLGSKPATPDIPLEALTPGATYHYRLVARNADGTTYGADMTVKVLPAPQVGPASVSEVMQESATITTSVNPEGLHTLYKLDVGTSSAYGTPYPGDAGSGSAPVPLTFNLTGLEPGTTYHFRLTASNGDGTGSEGDQTFMTAPTPVVPPFVLEVPTSLRLVPFTGPVWPKQTGTTTTETNAQKLAKALKACKKDKGKRKRVTCEKQARKRYAPVKKAKKGAH
jgi:hypothetical protein